MITTAKVNISKFEENLDRQDSFITRKMKCEYLTDKDISLENFYFSDNIDIMLTGQNLSFCGKPSEDEIESILSFCQFLGVYGIESELDNLPIKNRHSMYLMGYCKGGGKLRDKIIKNTNIYQFAQFCNRNFEDVSFDMIYSYFARKVNKRFSDIYYIEKNGKIVSGAVATDFGGDIYITFVSTDKEHRGQGLASEIINHIIAENAEKRIGIMCEKELIKFYEKLGFEYAAEIYLYRLRE